MVKSLAEQCRALAWTQWVALGVSGSEPAPMHAVDLEAAIAFTGELAVLDPRLHDEALDWCVQFADGLVSVSALRHVVTSVAVEQRGHFDAFAATVNSLAGASWPTNGTPLPRFKPSGKSALRMGSPATVTLRARKVFGVNARADVLVTLAQDDDARRWVHASSFSAHGYTKRAVHTALADLAAGGALDTMRDGNANIYALRAPAPLGQLLGPMPAKSPRAWGTILALASALLAAQRASTGKSTITAAVNADNAIRAYHRRLAAIRVVPPEVDPGDPWPGVERWIEPLLVP